jgi:predicted ABC-type ATPase
LEVPRLVIAGGPNGAGKTTLVLKLAELWQIEYLGADRVAGELGLDGMGADAIRAGREFVGRIARSLAGRRSILLESTLSGLATRRLIQRFRDAGYDITVVLVFVDGPDVSIERIRTRVARGGHFVPEADVRRRFFRSLRNFWTIYRLQADRWQLHYNGGSGMMTSARGEHEQTVVLDEPSFALFERLLAIS